MSPVAEGALMGIACAAAFAAGERVTVSAAIPSESDPARTADAKGSAAVG